MAAAASRISDVGMRLNITVHEDVVPGGIIRETTFASEAVKPAAKVALEGLGKTGILGGIAQGVTDFIFHPELTPGQRAGRIAIGIAVAAIAGAAAPVVLTSMGFAATTGAVIAASMVVGATIDHFLIQPYVYLRLGLGN